MKPLNDSNPTILARETLRQLASLRIPPTPDNYHRLYDQISGKSGDDVNSAVATMNQHKSTDISTAESIATWGETIEALLKQLEKKQGALTTAKKRESINRVLAKFSKDSNQLHTKLNALVNSWGALAAATQESNEDGQMQDPSSQVTQIDSEKQTTQLKRAVIEQSQVAGHFTDQLLELLAQMLEQVIARQIGDVALAEEARMLASQVRKIQDKLEMERFAAGFQQFCGKFDAYGESGIKLQQGLLKLLNMLMESTGELLAEDQWIGARISKLRETISKPLDQQVITQAEYFLEEITQRQEIIGRSLSEAKVTLKQMVTSLISNIEELTDTTDEYQNRLEQYSERISNTDDIKELNQLLVMIMEETSQMKKSTLSYRNDFLAARAEVDLAQNKINKLETELHEMGEKVHEDHLTGILNRRGLDNAFERETSRSARHQVPLCYALLDIDNFKLLNDTHGHKVGDDALVYLVESVKDTTRPEDIVSRYGGEEFVILLPNTDLEEAVHIISRIRRNLTKKFFLHENKRLLITFSAGVAQLRTGELQESIFKRADEALYRAKKGGKNQILTSE
ncbi:GGDEF domain-containing protein [Nitrosomonas sp.]|uniref:sensor domain-containing diguanylate cyclase n=1 Tax=Nitrosomonas sp. TaxID=42353 RepID=UPI0025F5EA15|nr:GGDEF domain-containing protein [Nitrosomonas sp.]MBY0483162.1 diguanylate cyclase [Nitrosomonas sp.]